MNRCPNCNSRDITGKTCASCSFSPSLLSGFESYAPELAERAPGYNPEHYAVLAGLEASNFWFRARNSLILYALGKYFPNFGSFLEVGCGTGFVLGAIAEAYPRARIHGSEIHVEGLGFASARIPRAYLVQLDARSIPYCEQFDVIGAFDVVEHIEEDARVLEELYIAMRPGGGIILTVPQHAWLWSSQDEAAHHVRRYSREELLGKVAAAGFSVAWTTSFVSLLLPAMWASRLRRRRPSDDPSETFSELRISGILNWAMMGVMRIELFMIRLGIRFPIGGSRIIVAYRKE